MKTEIFGSMVRIVNYFKNDCLLKILKERIRYAFFFCVNIKEKGYVMSLTVYLGIDVGSVTTKLALVDEKGKYVDSYMLRTAGKPVDAVQKGLNELFAKKITDYDVMGVGTTGSGRNLAGALVGADVIKNEITAHAVAASINVPGVQTILEIGGQDSKIIILRDGIVTDFAMNTVCAAGTGSFLDHQAQRLNVPIEEFGETALKSQNPARIWSVSGFGQKLSCQFGIGQRTLTRILVPRRRRNQYRYGKSF